MLFRKKKLIFKINQGTDWGLQLAHMKEESLVIVDKHATVNKLQGLVHTARHIVGVYWI
jgi:hypothetical protein